jgi:metal-responsive CopG/Arc/MetJ family transcriptional regulator
MKVAVSLPDELFDDGEAAAERLGLNRSQLYARALAEYLAARSIDQVTARLDELADEMPSGDGPAAGRRLIDAGSWEW